MRSRTGAGPSGPVQRILALQRSAGNRAVAAAIVQRIPPPAVPFTDPARIRTLTLGALDDYARDRPDWMTDGRLPAGTDRSLIDLLRWARVGSPAPLDAARPFVVSDLLSQTAAERAELGVYARAKQREDSAVPPDGITSLPEAVELGRTVQELERRLPKADLHRGLGAQDSAKAELQTLAASGKAADLADYFRGARAFLEAENGRDSRSYREWGADPAAFIGRVPDVRNIHRFPKPMIEALIANRADRSRTKPLVVVLHSGSDHNGAFHADAGMTAVVTHAANLTLMIEGVGNLEAAGDRVTALARAYGQGRRVQQVMLAGHGGPTSIELAGRPGASVSAESEGAGRARTERFIRRLVGVMAPGPNARIVLNACLTAAEPVSDSLPADPGLARAAILHRLTTDPSIATLLHNMAGGRTVEGNVASVGAGSYITPAGELHQTITGDEAATSTNPADYVERGHEPEGAARSLVVLWARDAAAATSAIAARRGHGFTSWGDRVIQAMFDIFESSGDIAGMSRVAEQSSRGLSEFENRNHQTPGEVGWLQNVDPFETALTARVRAIPGLGAGGKVALDQVRLSPDPTRAPEIVALVEASASLDVLRRHLDASWLAARLPALLPLASAPAPTRAQIMIAAFTLGSDPHAEAFLRANASGTRLVPPAGTTVDGLTDADPSENTLLEQLGIVRAAPVVPVGGGPVAPGVQSLSLRGRTKEWLNVREEPDIASPRVDVLRRGTNIDVIGQIGRWYAVLWRSNMRFVVKRFLAVR
ncbi:SH3 domain-containing protein [Agromyces sp. LHK192]|uniref:SH3 domain-containing protein n=1 Tax=Agromyces sp. LHK192 TaxID=2498704 RepID=UPI000FD6DFB0|nr:SH3 domain-containing protein [Agromyces sp. LHK192]